MNEPVKEWLARFAIGWACAAVVVAGRGHWWEALILGPIAPILHYWFCHAVVTVAIWSYKRAGR